jgi:hypothetical protein
MFSKTYLRQPAGQTDSERLRNRLAARAAEQLRDDATRTLFVQRVEQETGARVPRGIATWDVAGFFRQADMRDILDAVSCVADAVSRHGRQAALDWVEFCKRALVEEGMAYRVDDDGGVRYVVDVAFHELADSVVATLSRGRYVAAGASLNSAVEQITKSQPDGRHAIRDAFDGVETAFKVAIDSDKGLTSANIAALLSPLINRRFERGDPIAQGATVQTLESLRDWTNACHKYRHGHNLEELVEPPLDLTVVLVGNGLNFARWIAALGG